jgi:ribosomal protein S7
MDEYLDVIANDINEEEIESFRDNLGKLQDELEFKKWKVFVPLSTQSVDTEKIRRISEELRDTCIYETELSEKEKMKSIMKT